MRSRSEAGLTLIEVLIAVTLLALLSVAILMAMRVGLSAVQKANTRVIENRRVVSVQRILEQQIAGFIPVVAECQAGEGEVPVNVPFFQGEPQSMRFVSSYSLQEGARGYPRILEFQVIPGDAGRGVRLVVNEHLYAGPVTAGRFCLGIGQDPGSGQPTPIFPPIQIGPGSFVLADRLAYCRFWYHEEPPPPAPDVWIPRWTSPRWATGIRIDMAPLEPRAAHLQLLPLAVPLRVTADPNVAYVDH